jgi:hypothetical protein
LPQQGFQHQREQSSWPLTQQGYVLEEKKVLLNCCTWWWSRHYFGWFRSRFEEFDLTALFDDFWRDDWGAIAAPTLLTVAF